MQHFLYLTSAYRKLNKSLCCRFCCAMTDCDYIVEKSSVMEYASLWHLVACLVVCTDIFINSLFVATGGSM